MTDPWRYPILLHGGPHNGKTWLMRRLPPAKLTLGQATYARRPWITATADYDWQE